MFLAKPLLFLQLRLATFCGIIGISQLYPWKDNLETSNNHPPNFWTDFIQDTKQGIKRNPELFGYTLKQRPFPIFTSRLHDWVKTNANSLFQLVVCIFLTLQFRRIPLSSSIALGELIRVSLFFLFAPASVFLYLYDLHLLGFLLPMMALTEQAIRSKNVTTK